MIQKTPLTSEESDAIHRLLADVTGRYRSAEDPEFLARAPLVAHELPRRLRRVLLEFRRTERPNVCILSDWPVDGDAIGPTPPHWKERRDPAPTLAEEMLLVLFGSLLGDPIGWSTQQQGHIVHDILPIQGHEHEQLGSGSEELLTWHVEDAFHPYRGDYLGMMCLRNADGVPTTMASIDDVELPDEEKRILFEPRFVIRPDESHLLKNRGNDRVDPLLRHAYERIESMSRRPQKIQILYGSPDSPYVRLDPYFMDPLEDDPKAQEVLDRLIERIDGRLADVVLEPGDFCFIDNCKVVHGRKPFRARFDGTDRWIKRINVTRDLRKSRNARIAPDDPVIY